MWGPHGEKAQEIARKCLPTGLGIENIAELEINCARRALKDQNISRFRPKVYHTLMNHEKEQYITVMERVEPEAVLIGGTVNFEPWDRYFRFRVIEELAKFHAHYLGNTVALETDFGGVLERHPRRHLLGLAYWRESLRANVEKYPRVVTEKRRNLLTKYLDNLEEITADIESFPFTFVHFDPHPGLYILILELFNKRFNRNN